MKEMPNLYLIYNKQFLNWEERIQLLEEAANRLEIKSILVHSEEFDFTAWQEIPAKKTDMFYNVTPFSHDIENIFIHKGLTSFFIKPNKLNHLYSTHQLDISLINSGISVPKTVLKGTNERVLLKKYVEYVGGFPLILKVTGGSLGIGVIKIDSWEGLISTADYLMNTKQHFQLKEFIENKGTVRVIVVGNSILTSLFRSNLACDFRVSGANGRNFSDYVLDNKYHDLCINAAKSSNFEFVGIDLVFDKNNNPYILEVNFPNNFATPQLIFKKEIAFNAIKFLKEKSLR